MKICGFSCYDIAWSFSSLNSESFEVFKKKLRQHWAAQLARTGKAWITRSENLLSIFDKARAIAACSRMDLKPDIITDESVKFIFKFNKKVWLKSCCREEKPRSSLDQTLIRVQKQTNCHIRQLIFYTHVWRIQVVHFSLPFNESLHKASRRKTPLNFNEVVALKRAQWIAQCIIHRDSVLRWVLR